MREVDESSYEKRPQLKSSGIQLDLEKNCSKTSEGYFQINKLENQYSKECTAFMKEAILD